MSYTLQFQLTDTIAASASLGSGATSTTLTGGNFGAPSGTQIYVVDYDIPGTAEIISATVNGTAVTSITRGLAGGAAGTTSHVAGAKVGAFFVPQHYSGITDGSGFQTGSSSIGIPAAAVKQEAWASYTSTLTGWSGTPTQANGFIRIGNTVHCIISISGTSNATSKTITLPVAIKQQVTLFPFKITDNGTAAAQLTYADTTTASAVVTVYTSQTGGAWTNSGTAVIVARLTYEV